MILTASIIRRFWLKVDQRGPHDCWNWLAGKMGSGYGIFMVIQHNSVLAHRLSYQLEKGDIPEGLNLDHLCGNRACVNPNHLEAVTNAENIRRGNTGKCWLKLTDSQVREIRRRYKSDGPTRLSQEFSVRKETIRRIHLRMRRKDIA